LSGYGGWCEETSVIFIPANNHGDFGEASGFEKGGWYIRDEVAVHYRAECFKTVKCPEFLSDLHFDIYKLVKRKAPKAFQ
jgi:hypothetical protein